MPEYHWRKDSVALVDSERILGSDSELLVILNVQASDAGSYDCVVNDILGCTNTSDPATLTVTTPCPADLDSDGDMDAADLAELLLAWGANPNHPADFNHDGQVDASDLADLLAAWGPCQ